VLQAPLHSLRKFSLLLQQVIIKRRLKLIAQVLHLLALLVQKYKY